MYSRFVEDFHNSKLPRGLEEVLHRYRDGSGLIVVSRKGSNERPQVNPHPPKQSPRKRNRSESSTRTTPPQKTGKYTESTIYF